MNKIAFIIQKFLYERDINFSQTMLENKFKKLIGIYNYEKM